jgi:amino acid adenylation domain-containing protein
MNPLALSYQKRTSDVPLIRFLPEEVLGANGEDMQETLTVRTISLEEMQLLNNAATQLNVTTESLLLAGFASLLVRLTRQGVVAIAVGSSETAIFNLEDDSPFREAVRQSQNRQHEVPATGPVTDQGIYYQFLADGESMTGIASCGLQLAAKNSGSRLELASPIGLWQAETLKTWLGFLLISLDAAAQNPDLPINRLPLWNQSEARNFYSSLNQTAVEFSGEPSVTGRFAVQAKRRPEATAVISSNRQYTYRELDELSTQLARRLIALGASPNRAVAVCMERSVDLLLALLAVLKSGAYYVPLDPHNPSQRLRGILEECNPAVLLSDSAVADSLSGSLELDSLTILCVDRPWAPVEELPALPNVIDKLDLAYTIYTSGTTGKPKGVRITHQALSNFICSMWEEPGISETDRTLAVAGISFDIATMDMFLPICSGGTLVIASRQDSMYPHRLTQLLKEHDITCMQATPVTWRLLITFGWSGKPNLKMISGGEALPRELANDLLKRGGELWNCYGPTETTIYSGVIRIKPESGIVPVGPPIANTSFYVMDGAGNLLPPGVPGELYIGGLGVSPGYVARPELTSQRFVPDKFGPDPQRSLFATGDLVRIVNGNQFEFFGRLDHQVKLRGFRIELGEIESVLRTHPSIADAVVVLREDLPGEPRLVAYVIWSGRQVGATALREHASKSLPEYMLPSLVVTLDQYPLTASGKINRRALPIPESIPGQISVDPPEATAATDELETKLLHIFREVLRNDSIGVTDSFFRYGGYSLLTVRLFSQIDRELHVRLPISLLFDAPTVRDLARVIRKGISPSVIVPIRPYGKSAPIFIIQSYLLYSVMLEIVETDRPVYGVREMGDEREPMSTEDRARKFVQEILAVYPNGPLYLAGWCAAGTLTVEIARQLQEAGHQVGLVALFDAERPGFTLPKGLAPSISRSWKKAVYHARRMQRIPWRERVTYVSEALRRNWDWAVESYYTANYRTMLWLQKRIGISLSEVAFNNVYASMAALKDHTVRPYPGKLNLFRAADIPNFADMDATLGWGAIAQGGVEVSFVPGDHVSMFKNPHNLSLAQSLQQELRKSETATARI